MWIQLLCLMQPKMNKIHFWVVRDTSHQGYYYYFLKNSIRILCHVLMTVLSCGLKPINFSLIPLMRCFSSQVDFTSCGGFLCIAAILLMITGIVTAVILSFQYVRTLRSWSFNSFPSARASPCDMLRRSGADLWDWFHIQSPVFCHSTGPLAAYALRCNWSHCLHPGESPLTRIERNPSSLLQLLLKGHISPYVLEFTNWFFRNCSI